MDALGPLPPGQLKGRVQVMFVNAAGQEEAGIDGGGLFKEFVDQLTKAAFDPDGNDLFSATDEGLLYAANAAATGPSSKHSRLARYEFCGRIIGKAAAGVAYGSRRRRGRSDRRGDVVRGDAATRLDGLSTS